MPDSAAFTVLKAATIASSIGLFASPLPDLLRIHRSKVIGEVSVVPLVSMCGCGFLWVLYGLLTSSIFPVAVTNILGVVASGSYISVYLYYTPAKRYVMTLLAWVALGLGCVTLYAVLGASRVTGQTNKQVGKVVGFVAVGVTLILYGSPFETIAKVVRTKSASSLPIALCFVAMLNCALWMLYGILDSDMFVLTPNVIGLAFSIVQVALYVKYRPGKVQSQSVSSEELSSVAVELSPKPENDGSDFAFTKLKSPTIEPMRSSLAPVPEHHA